MTTVAQVKGVFEDWLQMDHPFSQAVLDALPANVALLNKDGTIVAVNEAWRRFAVENGELAERSTGVGVNYLEVARHATGPFSDEAPSAYMGIKAVLDGSSSRFSLDYPCNSPNQPRWFQMQVTPLHESLPGFAVVLHLDITARKLAEDHLRNRLRQQQAVAELGMFAFKTTDFDELLSKTVETVSRSLDNEFAKVLELQPDGQSLLLRAGIGWNDGLVGHAVVPSERASQAGYTLLSNEPIIVADLHKETRFTGPALLFDHGIVSGISVVIPGTARPFGVLGTHSRQRRDYSNDDAFFLQSVANILADFIERERVETRNQLLVQSVEDYAIVMLDPTGIITTWNSGAERITGYTAEEAIGQSVVNFYLPEDVASGKPLLELKETAAKGRISHEGWRLGKGGKRFLAHCLTFALRDKAGKVVGFSRVVRDITAQRREEESLRSIVDHSVDAIFTINATGIVQSCGGAVRQVFGYTCCELVGQSINMLMPEPIRGEHDSYLANYLRTGVKKIIGNVREVTGLRKDGSAVPLEIVITEFRLDGEHFFTGILRDLTQQKRLEEQLRQSQKMEAIGQLAGGVAHDFNNLLTVINGYSEMVMTSLPANDPHKGLLAAVVKAGNRAADLTGQLLAFSRKQILAPKVLTLNVVAENSEKMLRRLIGEDVLLVTSYDPSLHRVKADPGQIEQVIINLAVNARDAMPEGGTLTIATFNMDLDEEHCQQYPGCKPGSYAVLAMTDTGCGMTPDVMAHIFEPFFTTKEVGKGTGLGLAMVYGIVKQSDGYIAVESTVGVGTTFKVFLPTVTEEPDVPRPDHDDKSPRRGNETVLLVEDEDGVRKLARLILEMHGYKVVEASNGREAIEMEKTHDGPIDLLITDVVMPEISGRKLVETIRPRHPGIKVLYMSGYTDDAIVRHGVVDATDAFLQKPFSLPSLPKKVREVLDGKK